jgi:hypothetical protein
MGVIKIPSPVKLFSAILYSEALELHPVLEQLTLLLGNVDHRSPDYSFDFTDYYNDQMRPPLKKFFISFERLFNREEISQQKIKTNEIEKTYSVQEKQKVLRLLNIDPGYLTQSKVVLATTKNFSHRIYLRDGIYAEVTLNYENGKFVFNPWTFPDYRAEGALTFFNELRNIYVAQLKETLSRKPFPG